MPGFGRDFEDLIGESELDSAKMVLHLTSELRQKDLELASMRSRSFEEIQKNNKAKEEELEALMRAQDERIKKREQELARMLVEKESSLWQKYQAMLDDAVNRQRSELETERARLTAETEKSVTGLAAQKKGLRAETEELFNRWQQEREAEFKQERDAFAEKLRAAHEAAQKETLERIRQAEALAREKLSQQETDFKNRSELAAEEIRGQMRRERIEELKALNDRLNDEAAKREKEQYEHYAAWLEENKKTVENNAARRLEMAEAEFRERAARLEDSLSKARQDLTAREAAWESKYTEFKDLYAQKETALELAARDLQQQQLAQERETAERRETLAREAQAEALRRKEEQRKKEKDLEAAFAARSADLEAEAARRAKILEEREARSAAERAELNALRSQISSLLTAKEKELEQTFEERYALFRQSLEESLKIKETGLAKKQEDLERQYAALAEQKDAALARVNALLAENSRLKDALVSRDSQARSLIESERVTLEQERKRSEEEFRVKTEKLNQELDSREQALRASYEEKLKAGEERLAAQIKIKEAALEDERKSLNRHAAELEAGFLEALKTREAEVTDNFRRNADLMRAQAEAARMAWKEEKATLAAQAEKEAQKISAMELEAAARREAELKTFYENREVEAQARAAARLEAEQRHLSESYALKERDLHSRISELEQKLARTDDGTLAAQGETAALKEEIERQARALEEAAGEKQKLIQENLTKARDLRQTLEKEFLDKLREVEQNYMAQLTSLAKRSDETAKKEREEYFSKMQFMNDEFNARLAAQAKDLETTYMERERRLTASMEEAFKMKGKAMVARQEQLESSYQAMLSEKAAQIDMDRALADNVSRMKDELEAKNHQLSATIASYDNRLEEMERKQRSDFDLRKKDLEDGHRMRASQLEAERAKLKGVLEQEQRLVSDLQKREAALQDSYAAREADLAKRFKEARERLEKDYQDRAQDLNKKNGK